ncbi:LAMI_0H05314g1_1 [Lachancea mirantina]|uniref:LAMI_0H05314g1_1 n=1 Tax=Lachancea mirantina TaxID=1230905 RepID=A0A1G4KF27_9SACH|nr:LAMI_0H05314g1_1 [Lachancea mirantina]
MSFGHNENANDAKPRALRLTRAALNNVTNTSGLGAPPQETKPVGTISGARSFGKALRNARSKLQNAKVGGNLLPQSVRQQSEPIPGDRQSQLSHTSLVPASSGSLAPLETVSEHDKENADPFTANFTSVDEDSRAARALSSSDEELKYAEQQTMLKDAKFEHTHPQQHVDIDSSKMSETDQELSGGPQATVADASKKRPISTVVEHEEPKKFKVCEKGTEYEWEDLDAEDVNDPFMVSEYVDDIFEYLHKLEIMTLPNRHDLYKHSNIRQNRDILVNWMVKIHNKFGLLPETLYLSLNVMDRFLCKELVQLEKLQLVGTACLFIGSKYEEVYSPSVKHFAYETDGACDEDEIREGEKFILKTLEFNLNYPNPMNFLRRISKADDYDIQSRTLAKYLLEISIVDFRFIGVLPSLCAAAAMFLSRKMLGKGKWDGNLMHYSGGYTREELAPVCNMIMDYLVQPVIHDEFFKKYASRKFMKASVISRQWAKKVVAHGYDIMTLHEVSE